MNAIIWFIVLLVSVVSPSSISIKIGDSTWKTECAVGMTVKECREKIRHVNPFRAKTTAFCGPRLDDLSEDAIIKTSTLTVARRIKVVDYSFNVPIEYEVYACKNTLDSIVIERLNGSIDPHIKYQIYANEPSSDVDAIEVYPENTVLLRIPSRKTPVVVTKEKNINTYQLPDQHSVNVLCDAKGNELPEWHEYKSHVNHGNSKIMLITFNINGMEFSKQIQICKHTTFSQLRYRLTREFGPIEELKCRGGESTKCKDKDIVDEHDSIMVHLKSAHKLLYTCKNVLQTRCRWCTMSIAIASIMFFNAVLAVAAALYFRHTHGNNHVQVPEHQ